MGNFLTSLPLQRNFGGKTNEFQGKKVKLSRSVSAGVHLNYPQMYCVILSEFEGKHD